MGAVADTSLPVLITGETGTGKELFARALHRVSGKPGKFICVNVAGVDDTLFSDTLFGHRRGAFTGADRDRSGLIEEAENGTLFLDEIGDLGMESQVKLLRLLQEHTYYPLGSDILKRSGARIAAATNRDLCSLQQDGGFRKDLFYRLCTHRVHIPPLRERRDDIPILVEYLLEKAAAEMDRRKPTVPRELFVLLNTHPFPGNVRELEGMICDAVSRHHSGVLSLESFREKIGVPMERLVDTASTANLHTFSLSNNTLVFPEELPTLRELEDTLIAEALRRAEGNQSIAARLLGISRTTLNSRLNRK
jgi:DNA-binding NtrC family response regulator